MSPDDIASRAYVDEIQGRLRDELIAHLDEIDERETSARREHEASLVAKADAASAAMAAESARREELWKANEAHNAAVLRTIRVTQLAEVAVRIIKLVPFSYDGEHLLSTRRVDAAIETADAIVADCERVVDAREVSP